MTRVEILTGRERRRSWSGEQKLAILSEVASGEGTVAEIARRHDILAPQIYA
jgi:transposase